MRKVLLAACAAIGVALAMPPAVAGTFDAQGEFAGTVSPEVETILSLHPNGGPALTVAIALLLERDPRLADDVVFAARSANPDQQRAIGYAIAQAARFFALCRQTPTETCRVGEGYLRHAILFADPITVIAYNENNGSVVAADNPGSVPPIFIPGIGNNNCVPAISPATTTGC